MAFLYLQQLSHQLSFTYESETTKYERYKFDYEYIKLQMEYNSNPESLSKFIAEYREHINNTYLSNIMPAKI